MKTMDDGVEILAMSRAQAYLWLQAALGYAPEPDMLEWTLAEQNMSALAAFEESDLPFSKALRSVMADVDALRSDEGAKRELAASAYTRLFIGPDTLPVRPWESSWRGSDESLFQERTLEVRRAYFAEGYVCAGYPHVADDYIAMELDFMASLGVRLVEALERSNGEEARRLAVSSRAFLRDHMLTWVPEYAKACSSLPADYGFYIDVVQLTKEFLRLDDTALVELIDAFGTRQGERAYGQGDRHTKS